MITSWPQAIVHLDADAFFASVEQALNPKLKGKPVITGAERGIVAAASYEAKSLGIQRGARLYEIKKLFPQVICLPSDYETYSLFSKRLFVIMRRFTPCVEEYSIDEAFADLAGLRRVHRKSFAEIAQDMKQSVEKELGLTVSVGLSLTKSLAKLCSKKQKPSGLVICSGRMIHHLLQSTPLEAVWGFGQNTVSLLQKQGLSTAWDYVQKPIEFAKKYLGKIGVEIHQELSGVSVYPVTTQEKTAYATISKAKTFAPPSADRDYLYAQALKNVESACIKARRYELGAMSLSLFLRTQNFFGSGALVKLSRQTNNPMDLADPLRQLLAQCLQANTLYRQTAVILGDLQPMREVQLNFFEDPVRALKLEQINRVIDEVNARYGKHKLHLADSTPAQGAHAGRRGPAPSRQQNRLKGETERQHLGLPLLLHVLGFLFPLPLIP